MSEIKKVTLSNSRISTFRSCIRKYWFQYVEKLKKKGKSGKLQLGIAVDLAVKEYFKMYRATEGKVDGSKEEARKVMYEVVNNHFAEEVKKAESKGMLDYGEYKTELEELRELACCMVDNFLEEWNDQATKLLFDEVVEIDVPHTVHAVNLCGENGEVEIKVDYLFIPDMIVRMNGKIWIVEFKTTKSIEFDSYRRDEQGRSYVWGYNQVLKERGSTEEVQGIIYILLRKAKKTSRTKSALTGKCPIYVTRRELEIFHTEFLELCDIIARGDFKVYRSSSMECGWKCSYRSLCNEDNEDIREVEFTTKKGDDGNGN